MAEWLSQLDPWVGSAVAIATVGIAYVRLQSRLRNELASEARREAADRAEFRRSLLEHVAYVEDKRRGLEDRMVEMDRTHRTEMATMQGRLDEAHRRHMECEERFLAMLRGGVE